MMAETSVLPGHPGRVGERPDGRLRGQPDRRVVDPCDDGRWVCPHRHDRVHRFRPAVLATQLVCLRRDHGRRRERVRRWRLSPVGRFYACAAPGDYWWYASYGGDAANNPAASTWAPRWRRRSWPPRQQPGPARGPGQGPVRVRVQSRVGARTGAKPPAPTLSGVKLGSKRFAAKKGITLELTVSQPATIEVVIAETFKGHELRGACKPAAKKGKRCTTKVKRRTLTFSGSAGSNLSKLKLAGLGKGSYTATITAQNTSGQSNATRLTFTITHR